MFKKLALSGLLLSLFSMPLLAQQTTTPDAPTTTNRMNRNRSMEQRQMADPETRARKMTDRMTKQLGLDQTASQKVYEATLAHAQKVDAIRTSSDNKQAKMQAMKVNADDLKSKLQNILTPDQIAKLELMKGRMRNGRGRPDAMQDDSDQK